MLSFVLVAAIAAIVASTWIYALRRQVARRTNALNEELIEREKIEELNHRLVSAVEQSAEFVVIINNEGVVEYANLAFMLASGVMDATGKKLEALATRADQQIIVKALDSLGSSHVWRGRVHLCSSNDAEIDVAMTITRIRYDTIADGFVATGRDISHEEELEARLRHGEKLSALGTLAGGIAHDFNNLLVPILSYTDIIRQESSDKATPYIDSISVAGVRAQQLVQRILTFSRQHEGEQEPLNLYDEVQDAIKFLRSLLPATIEICMDLQVCDTVIADRTQIQQIILNLGTNAIDAMESEGGVLSISLEPYAVAEQGDDSLNDLPPGNYCCLRVTDTGKGISGEMQTRIFDPYYSDKPLGKGTGLGLSIVHGIISSLGGAIRVDSTPSKGTSLQLFFPTIAGVPTKRAPENDAKPVLGNGEQVLLVDDDEMVLDAIDTMLEGLGYTVTVQSDPLEALSAIQKAPDAFQVVLTDFTMPKLTGVQLADKIHGVNPDLPIVLMTGKTDLLEHSSMTSIAKPFRARELASCLNQVLSRVAYPEAS